MENVNSLRQAVEQCNEIESSLDNCLKILQQIRKPYLQSEDDNDDDDLEEKELSTKRSYTVCVGKKSPDLIDIDNAEHPSEEFQVDNQIESAEQKLQSILRTQESILQRLDAVNEKIMDQKPFDF